MGKNSTARAGNPSRIRFVMVDAELAEGDVGHIAQAIQNALRPQNGLRVKQITVPSANNVATAHDQDEFADQSDAVEEIEAEPETTQRTAKAPRRPPPTPQVVEIDMTSDVSLASFAKGRDNSSQTKKYLIAAAWLSEHRGITAVTANHIYTCFRSMQWSTSIPDFGQPLRDLKARRFFTKNGTGEYEINHIGLDYVKKLGNLNGTS